MGHTEQRCLELARDYAGLDLTAKYKRLTEEEVATGEVLDAVSDLVETATDALNGVTQGGWWDWDGTDLVLYAEEVSDGVVDAAGAR